MQWEIGSSDRYVTAELVVGSRTQDLYHLVHGGQSRHRPPMKLAHL